MPFIGAAPPNLTSIPSQSSGVHLSRPSAALPQNVERIKAVYQKASARKRKSSAPVRSWPKHTTTAPLREFTAPFPLARLAVASSLLTQDLLLLKEKVQESEKKFHQKDFKRALEIIDASLCKTDICILKDKIFSRSPLQQEHLQLLKIKGLCLVEAVKEHMSLESSVQLYSALNILIPLENYRSEDFEIQQALIFCYANLALCPSQTKLKTAHQLKADEAFKKAQGLRPLDLGIVRDWVGLKLQLRKYQEALQIFASIQAVLPECQDRSLLIRLQSDETLCNLFLAGHPANKSQAYYREQAQTSFRKLENMAGTDNTEIRFLKVFYSDILKNS